MSALIIFLLNKINVDPGVGIDAIQFISAQPMVQALLERSIDLNLEHAFVTD